MGRTLHYTLDLGRPFKTKELDILLRFQEHALERSWVGDKEAFDWTCEQYDLDPLAYYPKHATDTWESIAIRCEQLKQEGLNLVDRVKTMFLEGLIRWHNEDVLSSGKVSGLTKVRGNELNAMWVVDLLAAVSKCLPTARITVRDEGKYLLCPLVFQAGLAQPDFERVDKSIAYSCRKLTFKKFASKIKSTLKLFPEGFYTGDWGPVYAEEQSLRYLLEELADLATAVTRMKPYWDNYLASDTSPYRHLTQFGAGNITNRVFAPHSIFCRPVKVEDFRNFHADGEGVKNIMDGSYGEHWKLEDVDPEAESLRMAAKIFEMIPKGMVVKFNEPVGAR